MGRPIIFDVFDERKKQDEKWGKDRDLDPFFWLAILVEEVGEIAKAILEPNFSDPKNEKIRKEAVQVAAVALAFIENIDRNQEVDGD